MPPKRRAALRFHVRLRPSDEQWETYQIEPDEETKRDLWKGLAWAQGIYGDQTGLRQVSLRIELQLMPGEESAATGREAQQAIPFLGSAALYYEMHR